MHDGRVCYVRSYSVIARRSVAARHLHLLDALFRLSLYALARWRICLAAHMVKTIYILYIHTHTQKKNARNDADVTINELYFHESWATRVKLEWKERDGNGTALNPLKGEEVAGAVPSQLST